ncbi:MAG: DUF2339 domain-containing protein [Phycisphaerae bacterium]|nr:DUF2339 domain-containing protein [Phycisphaerae bacterium]
MEVLIIPIIIAVIGLILCGPIALIIAIIAMKKTNQLSWDLLTGKFSGKAAEKPIAEEKAKLVPPTLEQVIKQASEFEQVKKEKPESKIEPVLQKPKELAVAFSSAKQITNVKGTLEQRIGTLWVLIAGVVTVIVGVGFFLKFAYDNSLVGPMGRVAIAAIAGFVCLAIGEVTRKRGYGVVGKGVAALGFAILYAAVFSAYGFYGLIGSVPAFGLAILVTVAAMLYAVALNEMLIALLSLVGGFLTPILVSTGENLPMPLFTYVLILGLGAMLCAYYRHWRVVNLVSFVGTFLLYGGWFEKFYSKSIAEGARWPQQMWIAIIWLSVFFIIYLVLPLFNGIVKHTKAQREDVVLVIANAVATFSFLWQILYGDFRVALAFASIGLCAAHLVMLSAVTRRVKADVNLRIILLIAGLFFVTIAIPLYLKMYALAMAWAAEAVVLTIIGIRYKNVWTQLGACAALVLAVGQLIDQLPTHGAAFRPVINPAFGTWVFVAAMVLVCCIFYRRKTCDLPYRVIVSQWLYAAAVGLLGTAVAMEWYWHCDYNVFNSQIGEDRFYMGMWIIFTIFMFGFILRTLRPVGLVCKILGAAAGLAGTGFLLVTFTESYHSGFVIFANSNFGLALILLAGLFIAARLLWIYRDIKGEEDSGVLTYVLGLAGIVALLVLLSEEIYLYWWSKNRFGGGAANWRFLANMYISVAWAVYGAALMAVGVLKKAAILRYMSLGLFGLLLLKVFILDMSTVKSVYRIAAFMATGVTLVAVSYLYQYLKKQDFFDLMLSEKSEG